MIATTTEAPARCWSCGAPVSEPTAFCAACGAVQPPGAADHFVRLGLARGFDVDLADLERRYFDLQRSLHPDRFARRSEREQALSMQQSVALNEAYGSLKEPLRRAEYLLSLAGVTVNAENGNLPTDPAILAEAMADREAAEEANDLAEVDRLSDAVKARRAACEDGLAVHFTAGDTNGAARLATQLKYLATFADTLRVRRRLVSRGGS